MPRIPKLPFERLFDVPDPGDTVHTKDPATRLTRQGKVIYQNQPALRAYYGKEYGINEACQHCGRIVFETQLVGLVVAEELLADGRLCLHLDGVFHSPQCAYESLQSPGVVRNPLYQNAENWLYTLYPEFKPRPPGQVPIGRYEMWEPATNPGIVLLPACPTRITPK